MINYNMLDNAGHLSIATIPRKLPAPKNWSSHYTFATPVIVEQHCSTVAVSCLCWTASSSRSWSYSHCTMSLNQWNSLQNLSSLCANASQCSGIKGSPWSLSIAAASASSTAKARKAAIFQVSYRSDVRLNSPGVFSSWRLLPQPITAVVVAITKLALTLHLSHVTHVDQSNITQPPELAPTHPTLIAPLCIIEGQSSECIWWSIKHHSNLCRSAVRTKYCSLWHVIPYLPHSKTTFFWNWNSAIRGFWRCHFIINLQYMHYLHYEGQV